MRKVLKTKYRLIFLVFLGIVTFSTTAWTLRKDFYFLFDDIAWLREVKYYFDIKNFFHILPQSRYNDRPLRTFWFYILYNLFGMNYTAYYLVALLWHVLDTYLVYFLTKSVLKLIGTEKGFTGDDETKIFYKSFIVAVVFGIYPKNLMAVYWLAGTANDLLCGFFSLLTMIFYLKYMRNRKSWSSVVLSLVFFICAMRSKEAAICLPIIILIFEIYLLWENKLKFRLYYGNILLLIYMIIYLLKLLTLPATYTTEGQYKQVFSIETIFQVLLNYIRMYFSWDDGSFSYKIGEYYTKVGNVGILICLAIVIVILSNLVKKRNIAQSIGIIVLFMCSGLSLAPLLVLPNIQHMLYFYFPSIFLSMLFGLSLYKAVNFLFQSKYTNMYLSIGLICALVVLNNVGGAKTIRSNFETWGAEAKSTVEDIKNIETLPPNSNLYLIGVDAGANVFNYAPGYIVNIIYNDTTIVSQIVSDSTVYTAPYAIWEYNSGHVIEITRVLE